MTLVWTKGHSGWGTTEYTAKGKLGTYVAKKSGGRIHPWELLFNGKRTSAKTLRSCKEMAEMREERAAATADAMRDATDEALRTRLLRGRS